MAASTAAASAPASRFQASTAPEAASLGLAGRDERQRGQQEGRIDSAERAGKGAAGGEPAIAYGGDDVGGLRSARRIVGRCDRKLSGTFFR